MGRHAVPRPPAVPRAPIIGRTYTEGDARWRGILFTVGVILAAVAGLAGAALIFVDLLG